jgi:hypothetical protein
MDCQEKKRKTPTPWQDPSIKIRTLERTPDLGRRKVVQSYPTNPPNIYPNIQPIQIDQTPITFGASLRNEPFDTFEIEKFIAQEVPDLEDCHEWNGVIKRTCEDCVHYNGLHLPSVHCVLLHKCEFGVHITKK